MRCTDYLSFLTAVDLLKRSNVRTYFGNVNVNDHAVREKLADISLPQSSPSGGSHISRNLSP